MTEEEAKKKWCGLSQAAETPTQCDGSACMMWRWTDPPAPHRVVEPRRRGYCGMAGKP